MGWNRTFKTLAKEASYECCVLARKQKNTTQKSFTILHECKENIKQKKTKHEVKTKMQNKNANEKSLDNWDEYISGSFLKPVNVESDKDAFACIAVEVHDDERDGSSRLRLTLQKGEMEFDFDLNKTNATFLKTAGITSPKAMTGKKLYFKKVLVQNPKTKQEVESLRVSKIE